MEAGPKCQKSGQMSLSCNNTLKYNYLSPYGELPHKRRKRPSTSGRKTNNTTTGGSDAATVIGETHQTRPLKLAR